MSATVDQLPESRRATARWVFAGVTIGLMIVVWWLRQAPDGSSDFVTGLAAAERGDFVEAERCLALVKQGADPDAPRLLGAAILLHRGDLGTAEQELRGRQFSDPAHAELSLLIQGEALYRERRLLDARAALAQAAQLNPKHGPALLLLAAIDYDLGAMDSAQTALQIRLKSAPNDFRAWRLSGLIHQDFQRYEQAAQEYRHALDADPPSDVAADVTYRLADVLLQLRRPQEALTLLDQLGRKDARGCVLVAAAQTALGHPAEADAAIQAAERMAPTDQAVRRARARQLTQAGRDAEAITLLEQICGDAPLDLEAANLLVQCYAAVGRADDARTWSTRVLAQRQLQEELGDLNITAIQHPRDTLVRRRLAEVCRQLGREEMAKLWDQAAAALESATRPE